MSNVFRGTDEIRRQSQDDTDHGTGMVLDVQHPILGEGEAQDNPFAQTDAHRIRRRLCDDTRVACRLCMEGHLRKKETSNHRVEATRLPERQARASRVTFAL